MHSILLLQHLSNSSCLLAAVLKRHLACTTICHRATMSFSSPRPARLTPPLLLALLLAGQSLLASCLSQQPILVILSLDGFRYDYLSRANMTHFDQLRRRWTFVPHVRPVFPSKTYPNHISIATGLYSESHGVIGALHRPRHRPGDRRQRDRVLELQRCRSAPLGRCGCLDGGGGGGGGGGGECRLLRRVDRERSATGSWL